MSHLVLLCLSCILAILTVARSDYPGLKTVVIDPGERYNGSSLSNSSLRVYNEGVFPALTRLYEAITQGQNKSDVLERVVNASSYLFGLSFAAWRHSEYIKFVQDDYDIPLEAFRQQLWLFVKSGEGSSASTGALKNGKEEYGSSRRGNWSKVPYYTRWNKTIPYALDEDLSNRSRSKLAGAMQQWESRTCIRFLYNESWPDNVDHVVFVNGSGCHSSSIGREAGSGEHRVTLGTTCNTMNAAHEITHLLGMMHVHSRADRNNYIKINFRNIPPERQHNFDEAIQPLRSVGKYDYGSVLHYRGRAFAKDIRNYTIETRPITYQATIGQRYKLDFLDVKTINENYCRSRCHGRRPKCNYGGYANPLTCKCECPDGLRGTNCHGIKKTKSRCGRLKRRACASDQQLALRGEKNCNWLILASRKSVVQLTVENLNFPCFGPCLPQARVVLVTTNDASTGLTLCCEKFIANETMVSTGRRVVILYHGSRNTSFSVNFKQVPRIRSRTSASPLHRELSPNTDEQYSLPIQDSHAAGVHPHD